METQVWNSYVSSSLNYQISSTPFLLNNIFILTNITFLYRVVSTYIFLKYSYYRLKPLWSVLNFRLKLQ